MEKHELEEIAKIVIEKDLFVVSDEIYSELYLIREKTCYDRSNSRYERAYSPDQWLFQVLRTGPDWRLGYSSAKFDLKADVKDPSVCHHVRAYYQSVCGAVSALRNGDPDVEMMRESYDQRRRFR